MEVQFRTLLGSAHNSRQGRRFSCPLLAPFIGNALYLGILTIICFDPPYFNQTRSRLVHDLRPRKPEITACKGAWYLWFSYSYVRCESTISTKRNQYIILLFFRLAGYTCTISARYCMVLILIQNIKQYL